MLEEADWQLFELPTMSACPVHGQHANGIPAGLVDENCLRDSLRFRESWLAESVPLKGRMTEHYHTFAMGARLRSCEEFMINDYG